MRRFLVLAAVLALTSQAAAAGTLERVRDSGTFRMGYRADAKPYSYQNEQGQPAGYLVDLCLEIAKALGPNVNPQFVRVPAVQRFESVRDGRVEWMGAMANRLPMMIVGRIIGVPADDIDKLIDWGYSATQLLEGLVTPHELTAAGIAVMELSGYITEQFHRAAAGGQHNLLGDLATACARGELDDIAAQVMMITLFSAGGESTASLIGSLGSSASTSAVNTTR